MALNINGTTGISGVDGSASAASIAGTDANTGLSFASDTVNINTGGVTRATIDSSGALDVPTDFPIKVNGSEKLRIDSSGRLGIGITSPQEILHVKAASEAIDTRDGVIFGSTDSLAADKGLPLVWAAHIGTDADYGIASICGRKENATNDNGAGYLQFGTGSAAGAIGERMRIASDGDVLVGCTSTPSSSVSGFSIEDNAGKCLTKQATTDTGANTCCLFINPNGNVGSILTSGSSTAFNTSSDYRLKENAVAISDGITRLKTLKPYRFNFKADPSTILDGFFAHEVTAVPEAISGEKDAVREDGSIEPQGIDQSKLVPLLTAALQEAVAKIEVLETKVAALEAG
jgi:hypothetical protein